MTAPKTRCKQCFSSDIKVTKEPCNKCSEILSSAVIDYENQFLDASKNLMRED
ncbi:hypothetical protein [Clostridium estertheticum]|uniref:hypothetical protein n=1 Tax=Clostridium estertheticum TaxID=238834 RepID=UPI001C7D1372|nr:hypothetical protein [Clostridium estertheticum]MBX4266597.1 hypothetical protein [Clostridium estertheticum]WLC88065.1 hypothetical protein KTC95_18910 [Clostridium estertheticum]